MTEQPGWRPEQTLTLAILVAVAGVAVAAILVVGNVMRGGRLEEMVPTGLAVAAAGAVAALAINAWGRKFARTQRPEWLETKAWQSGLAAKLAAAKKRDDSGAKDAAANASATTESPEEKGPR